MLTDNATPQPLRQRLHVTLPFIAFALLVLAARWLLIAACGNATPYMDQWAAEGYYFYAPLMEGHFAWSDLFQNYNEHRITLTRILDLILLALNGQVWNPVLQMIVNAIIDICALLAVVVPLSRLCPPPRRALFLVSATVLFALPVHHANAVWGFQSQIYFVMLFSFLFLRGMAIRAPLSLAWWLGLGCGGLAYISFASSAASLAAGAGLMLLRTLRSEGGDLRQKVATTLVVATAILSVLFTPASPHGASMLMPANATEYVVALLRILAWPSIVIPLVCLPLFYFMWQQLRQTRLPLGEEAFLFAMGLWTLANAVLFAYGRGKFPVAPRYLDFYSVNLLLSLVCLLRYWRLPAGEDSRQTGSLPRRWRWFPATWAVVIMLGLATQSVLETSRLLTFRWPQSLAYERHFRDYLRTGNFHYLAINDFPLDPLIPAPPALKMILDDPAVRYVLPPNLLPQNALRQAGWVTGLTTHLRSAALMLLTLGLSLTLWLWLEAPAAPSNTGRADSRPED
jgi:hypothetical protein